MSYLLLLAGRIRYVLLVEPVIGMRMRSKSGLEALRPLVNNHVFKFITTNKFQCGDFIKTSDGIVRLTSDVAKTLLGETALPEQDIVQAPEFMLALILEARHVAVTSLRPRLPDSIPT